MRFVHTFYSKPLLNNKFKPFNVSINYTLVDYACSAAFIHKNGYEIILVTDNIGSSLLNFIPYDQIIVIEPDDNKSLHFAAQFKFEALKILSLDDVLIDGDLFIRKPEAFVKLEQCKEDVITSFYEPIEYILSNSGSVVFYKELIQQLNLIQYNHPFHAPTMGDLAWPNTSLIKFNSQELKDKYIEQYEYHCGLLNNIDFENKRPDIITEQYFLRLLIENFNYSYRDFVEKFPTMESNEIALKIGFTHLGADKAYLNDVVMDWLKNLDLGLYIATLENIIKHTTREDNKL